MTNFGLQANRLFDHYLNKYPGDVKKAAQYTAVAMEQHFKNKDLTKSEISELNEVHEQLIDMSNLNENEKKDFVETVSTLLTSLETQAADTKQPDPSNFHDDFLEGLQILGNTAFEPSDSLQQSIETLYPSQSTSANFAASKENHHPTALGETKSFESKNRPSTPDEFETNGITSSDIKLESTTNHSDSEIVTIDGNSFNLTKINKDGDCGPSSMAAALNQMSSPEEKRLTHSIDSVRQAIGIKLKEYPALVEAQCLNIITEAQQRATDENSDLGEYHFQGCPESLRQALLNVAIRLNETKRPITEDIKNTYISAMSSSGVHGGYFSELEFLMCAYQYNVNINIVVENRIQNITLNDQTNNTIWLRFENNHYDLLTPM